MNTDRYPFGALSQGTTLLADAITLRFPVRNELPASVSPSPGTDTRRQLAPRERKGWLNRLDTWFSRQRQNAREAYLAQAKDVFEVERRIRDLERNIGSRYY